MSKYQLTPAVRELNKANISVAVDLGFEQSTMPKPANDALKLNTNEASLGTQQTAELEQKIAAETILKGFKMYTDGRVEITIPKDITIPETRDLLIKLGETMGKKLSGSGILADGDPSFLAMLQADPKTRTIPGVTYEFHRTIDNIYGELLEGKNPYGAFILAELCLQLQEDPHVTSLRKETLSPNV